MKPLSIIQLTLLQLLLFCVTASAEGMLGENPERANLQPPELPTIRSQALALPGAYTYVVRIIYLVPSNRTPQADAERILQKYGLRVQGFYREQMERLGFGPKSFEFETEADGVVPKVHIVHVAEPDTNFHDFNFGARFFKILDGIASAGFPAFQRGEVFLVIAETQTQQADGSFLESSVMFAGASNFMSGAGVLTGETLARMPRTFLVDDRMYNGLIIPTIGPFPLVANVTFPSFEGLTVSSTSSSAQGGAAHELGHGFALSHDFRNDGNFNGNLLGNGARGLRGVFYPERYPNDDVRLSSASGLHLNSSRFFNARQLFTDNNPPLVAILTSGTVTPQNGLFQVKFLAQENQSSLAGAILLRNGSVVADMPLSGSFVETIIPTYLYEPGVTDMWEVFVYDTEGNRMSFTRELTAASGFPRAPIPHVDLSKTRIKAGEEVTLSARESDDPDGLRSQLHVEWDLDGDGLFDTTPTTTKEHVTSYSKAGVFQVTARLTDRDGNVSHSMPIGLRVDPPIVNNLVSFVPIASTFSSTDEARGCPSGDFGKFSFEATLHNNTSDREFSDLHVEIEELANNNLLRTEERLLMTGEVFPISRTEDYADGLLSSGESVDVPFMVCLNIRKPFRFFVNVLGEAGEAHTCPCLGLRVEDTVWADSYATVSCTDEFIRGPGLEFGQVRRLNSNVATVESLSVDGFFSGNFFQGGCSVGQAGSGLASGEEFSACQNSLGQIAANDGVACQ